jgi:ABC-type branched-subunit amino acid transport system substrate-binding protein
MAVLVAACTPTVAPTTTAPAPSTSVASTATTPPQPELVTGIGVGDGTIRVAAFLPLSGSLSTFGSQMLDGQRAYWAYVNDDLGGVGGEFRVVLDEVDTGYDPAVARDELLALSPEILGVVGNLGSPVTEAMLAVEAELPIMVGSEAAIWGQRPNAVFDLTVPTYRDQVSALVRWWDSRDGDAVGFVAPAGVYGDDCLAGMPGPPPAVVRYPPGTTDFGPVVEELGGLDAVLACVAPADLVRLVATFDLAGERPAILTVAAAYDRAAFAAQGELPGDLWVAGAPPPYESDEPGMRLFREVTAGLDEVTGWTFRGYMQAATLHALLEQALDDGVLTRSGVLAARSRLGEADFGFGREPSRYAGTLPVVEVVIAVPDPEARFGLRETPRP